MKTNQIKHQLFASVSTIASALQQFVTNPAKSFSRKSPLSFEQMIYAILAMGGKSLSKELLRLNLPVSNSAFVQRRYQIKPQAFYQLFRDFTRKIPVSASLPILAVDGSDLCIPRNRHDIGTSIKNGPENQSYNLVHINALYDITDGIYRDLVVHDTREKDERAAFIEMMENSPFRTSTRYNG